MTTIAAILLVCAACPLRRRLNGEEEEEEEEEAEVAVLTAGATGRVQAASTPKVMEVAVGGTIPAADAACASDEEDADALPLPNAEGPPLLPLRRRSSCFLDSKLELSVVAVSALCGVGASRAAVTNARESLTRGYSCAVRAGLLVSDEELGSASSLLQHTSAESEGALRMVSPLLAWLLLRPLETDA